MLSIVNILGQVSASNKTSCDQISPSIEEQIMVYIMFPVMWNLRNIVSMVPAKKLPNFEAKISAALLWKIQSSVIKTRSNIVRYYINNYWNWGRIWIRCWIYIRHPIDRASYPVSFVNICEKIDRIIAAPHCSKNLWIDVLIQYIPTNFHTVYSSLHFIVA